MSKILVARPTVLLMASKKQSALKLFVCAAVSNFALPFPAENGF